MHGVVGYTPRRDLDRMRLDWVRSPGEASEIMADVSASRYRKSTTFCTCCAKWRRNNHFRRDASTCTTCLKITCAACGERKKSTQYRSREVYFFLNAGQNARCQTCRQEGRKIRVSKHETDQRQKRRQSRCTKCGVYQDLSTFRRTKKGGRVDICRSCDLVKCEACAAMLERGDFAQSEISRYFGSTQTKHITCLVCKGRRRHAQKKRLQELMQKSKRRFCTCKHPQAHTRTCLLRVEFD